MVTNSEVLTVRGTSSFKSITETRPALYLGNEGSTSGVANPMILFNQGGANRGGIGYVPNTGELRQKDFASHQLVKQLLIRVLLVVQTK